MGRTKAVIDPLPHGKTALITGTNHSPRSAPPPHDGQFAVDARAPALLIAEFARPEDVADVITFLLSHQARCVTCQIVRMRRAVRECRTGR